MGGNLYGDHPPAQSGDDQSKTFHSNQNKKEKDKI